MSARPLVRRGTRRALVVWSVAVVAYGVAVFHRSSLGVAGIEAGERFGIGASLLASFAVVQLVVYAAMQVPVGVLLDRYGARRLLLYGAALMTTGQLLFAVVPDTRVALAARVLLGLGDAMTFISVLRLVPAWFAPRWVPVMSQLTGVVGQVGALLSAVPLVFLLRTVGWTPTYVAAATAGAAVAVAVVLLVRNSPTFGAPPHATEPISAADVRRRLRLAWQEPGTRLGMWTHFTAQFPGLVFLLLWGYPFLVSGQGLTPSTAGALLTVLILAGMVSGPVLGHLVARYPFHRSWLVLAIIGLTVASWTVVLLWPGPAPLGLLVVLVLSLAVNGPGSLIGFDYARTFNPPDRLGSATGIVNVGGFVASFVTIALIGVVLDLTSPGGSSGHSLDSFRWAFAVQYLVWAVGVVQVLRYRSRARRTLAERDPDAYRALRRGEVVVRA